MDHMYQYSLDSFSVFFYKSIERAPQPETEGDLPARVQNLRDSLRMTIYVWVARGLFERHKTILMAQLTFTLMNRGVLGDDMKINPQYLQFLLRGPRKVGEDNTI